jgi:hypothetical protein
LKKQKEMANSDSTVTTKYCRKDFLLTYGWNCWNTPQGR